jgi:hypothetical protein
LRYHASLYARISLLYKFPYPASLGEMAMENFNPGIRACEARQADDDLACEVGPVHDYFWHRRHRARHGGQLVDIAIVLALAMMVVWTLALHH